MILIIGGRWQGKRSFAAARFDLADDDIFTCGADIQDIDFSHRCIDRIDLWALNCVRLGVDPVERIDGETDRLSDAIVIAADISCGVVPVDAEMRAWREAAGRLNALLADRADEVWRLFCGLPQRIK